MDQGEVTMRPYWAARNWVRGNPDGGPRAGTEAAGGNFRAGTVAGSVHLDQCAALLVQEFGKRWFERGALSLYLANASSDGEQVQAVCEVPRDRAQIGLWVRREDGLELAAGTASMEDHGASALRTRDLRPTEPDRLRILRKLVPGKTIGEWKPRLEAAGQLQRHRAGAISDPLTWYAGDSPWGGPIAAPSTAVELLWGVPMRALARRLGGAVGLFGAIEVAHHAGPLRLGERYQVDAEVVALAESPRTECLWFDSFAWQGGVLVASQRTLLRFMKAQSGYHSPDAGGLIHK